MMTAEQPPRTHDDWDAVLTEADVPANELVRLLVDVYNLSQEKAYVIVGRWLYANET